jgi:hypothetical protein
MPVAVQSVLRHLWRLPLYCLLLFWAVVSATAWVTDRPAVEVFHALGPEGILLLSGFALIYWGWRVAALDD